MSLSRQFHTASLNDVAGLLEYIPFKSRKTIPEIKEILKKKSNIKQIVRNIQSLHKSLGTYTRQNSNILALVTGLHSQKSLKGFRVAFSPKQYELVRENEIGGSTVESSSSFYEKVQISDLYFCVVYKKDGHITRKRFGHLSISLTHNSFYNINFFFENHGKSDVDGHFEVLSRWFSHAEAHQNINPITELKGRFERKAHADSLTRGNGNPGKYNFKVYPRDVPRSERYQVKIKDGIKLFLSYIFIEGKLLASPICSKDLASYNLVAYKEAKISDKMSNKYVSDHIQRESSRDALMGPSSIEIQTKRVRMLRGLGRRVGQLDAGQTENAEYEGTEPDQSPHPTATRLVLPSSSSKGSPHG
ncbi:hypothetical protein BB560_003294, partial [Smittium megazygosporum]